MKPFTKIISLSIAMISMSVTIVVGQEIAVEAEEAVQKYMDKNVFIGLTAGISKKGTTTWTTAQGYRNVEVKEAMTVPTKMRTASIAKSMTAVAVMQLVEQDLIDLDLPIQTYIPNYPKKKKGDITTRQLLNQTSGIPAYASAKEAQTQQEYANLGEAVNVFKDRGLIFQPGTEFYYTTYGYVVLGLIIEKVSGLTYEEYMTKNIWEKAGMHNTGVEKYQSEYANKSSLYHRNKRGKIRLAKKENNLSNRIPGGGFYSTVEDLMRFGEAIINNELISSETLKLMIVDTGLKKEGNGYGAGWFLYGSPENRSGCFGHNGQQTGVSAQLMIIPARNIVVAVLSNTSGAWEEAIRLSVDLIEIAKTGKNLGE